MDFAGYAYGGLGIGEPKTQLFETLELGHGLLPADRPRYLMGMGYIEDIIEAVARGVDLFDCVLPTRNARNGTLFTSRGRVAIKNVKYARDRAAARRGLLLLPPAAASAGPTSAISTSATRSPRPS